MLNDKLIHKHFLTPVPSTGVYTLDAVGYDLSGNITSLQRRNSSGAMWDNLSMSYTSGTNRMSGFSNSASGYPDVLTLGYDANGNVTQYENADFSIYQTMGYDAYDRMVSVDEGMGTTVTQYRYNSDGWRYYRKRGSLNPVYSIRDGSISLAEYTGTTGGVTWNIVLPDGTPIGRKPFSSGKSFYYRDHLGSTRTVVYENGTIQQVLDYYPFGLEMSGRGMVSGSPVLQRFTGYERTSESMLDYAGARWYNPRLGRFWSVDPMAGEFPAWSPYNYAFNNPLRFIDPTGEYPTCGDNCDVNYQEGSVVENQYGVWTYAGNNQWTDVKGNTVSGTDLLASFNQILNGGFISQWEPSWADRWSESSNIFASLSYGLLNSPWVAFQVLNPFDNTVTHISGALATPREQLDAGVASAPIGYGVGKAAQSVRFMRYPNAGGGGINVYSNGQRVFGVDWHRFNLKGQTVNRPHYHRGATKSQMKKHRPWQGGW